MRKVLTAVIVGVVVASFAAVASAKEVEKSRGEALFKQHCVACHIDGGNTINPKKTLSKKDMEVNKVRTANDIVKLMRNPGPGMIKFDDKTISEKDAKEIAEYILKTYK